MSSQPIAHEVFRNEISSNQPHYVGAPELTFKGKIQGPSVFLKRCAYKNMLFVKPTPVDSPIYYFAFTRCDIGIFLLRIIAIVLLFVTIVIKVSTMPLYSITMLLVVVSNRQDQWINHIYVILNDIRILMLQIDY